MPGHSYTKRLTPAMKIAICSIAFAILACLCGWLIWHRDRPEHQLSEAGKRRVVLSEEQAAPSRKRAASHPKDEKQTLQQDLNGTGKKEEEEPAHESLSPQCQWESS